MEVADEISYFSRAHLCIAFSENKLKFKKPVKLLTL